jgi:hypothetical protein
MEKENAAFQSKSLAHFGRGGTTAVVGEGLVQRITYNEN